MILMLLARAHKHKHSQPWSSLMCLVCGPGHICANFTGIMLTAILQFTASGPSKGCRMIA